MATKPRWIMYLSQNIPGNQTFELDWVASLRAARDAYEEFCRGVYSDDCSATLYAYTEEAWQTAQEFRDTGCPFDYPDRIIERGPRGGITISNT